MLELFAESPGVFAGAAFAVALLIGSFLNVVIYRLPIMMEREWRDNCAELAKQPATDVPEGVFNILVPRSRCPHCGTPIGVLQNIPVLSYLTLAGKCGECSGTISARYPLVEFATAVLAAVVAWRFGPGWEAVAGIALTFALIPITMIDFDRQLIPDVIVLPLLWLGLGLSLLHPFAGAEVLFIAPRDAIIGAIAGYLVFWAVYHVFRLLTGKEGMGYGDFKLLAALGAWLGWQVLPTIVLLSAVVGAIVGIALIVLRGRDRQLPIPFGPYLAAAGWIAMLWGESLQRAYFGLFA